jgi:hypothetical protein
MGLDLGSFINDVASQANKKSTTPASQNNFNVFGNIEGLVTIPIVSKFAAPLLSLDLSAMFSAGIPSYPLAGNDEPLDPEQIVTPNAPEPLLSYTLPNFIISEQQGSSVFYSALQQALLEDRISQAFAASLIGKISAADPKFLSELEKKLKGQINSTQNILDSISNLFSLLKNFDYGLSPTASAQSIRNQTLSLLEKYKIEKDPLVKSDVLLDPLWFLDSISNGASDVNLKSKTRTTLATQTLQVFAEYLTFGASNRLSGRDILTSVFPGKNAVEIPKSPFGSSIKALAVNSDQLRVYGLEEYSYVDLNFYKELNAARYIPERRSAMLASILANEFAMSAGLGRLVNTPLGNRFGAISSDPVLQYVGVKNLVDASLETAVPGSIIDALVTDENGISRTSNGDKSQRVLLLDGTPAGTGKRVKNSFGQFAQSVVRKPNNNDFGKFDTALQFCAKEFDDGIDYYKKLHCRDVNETILTPRGLYTECLSAIESAMTELTVSSKEANNKKLAELAVLKTLAANNSTSSEKFVGEVKHYLLGILVRKIAALLSNKNYGVTSGANQSSTTKKTVTDVKVTTGKGANTKTENSSVESSTMQSEDLSAYTPDKNTIRFVAGEKERNLLNSNWSSKDFVRLKTVLAGCALGTLGGTSSSGKNYIFGDDDLYVIDLFTDIASSQSTYLLDRIAKIYVSMCESALKVAQTDSGESSWLDGNRLSRKSRIDGTLSASILFESFLSLVDAFVDDVKLKETKGGMSQWCAEEFGNSSGKVKDITKFAGPGDNPLTFSVSAAIGIQGKNALRRKALSLLVQGSKNNDFTPLVRPDGSVPDLDGQQSTKIQVSQTKSANFQWHIDYLRLLARDRDLPLAAIVAVQAMIKDTQDISAKLSTAASMLRGATPPSQEMKDIRDFVSTDSGKKFMSTVTDYSVEIAQDRLDRFSVALNSGAKRNSKITGAEIVCANVILKELREGTSPNTNVFVIGLPGDFITNELLPTFSLASGATTDLSRKTFNCSAKKTNPITENKYQDVQRSFPVRRLVNVASFAPFESSPPEGLDDLINRVVLRTGVTGLNWINEKAESRQILKNEVFSHLLKRCIAATSSIGVSEEQMVDVDTTTKNDALVRGASSLTTAQRFATAGNLPAGTFDSAWQANGKNTLLNVTQMLKISAAQPVGNTIQLPAIATEHAELFYDIFESIYFYDGVIQNVVFSTAHFDKTVAFFVGQNEFVQVNRGNNNGLSQSDPTQVNLDAGTFSFEISGV